MAIRPFQEKRPEIAANVFIDATALVIGDVSIGEDASIWPMTVVRGDVNAIRIGQRSNVQDGTVIHVAHDSEYTPGGFPTLIGDDVTIGHRAVVHACTIGNSCLIGMSATILDGAVIGDYAIIGAGSLVPAGKELEGGYLYLGSPARRVRELSEKEKGFLDYSAEHYVRLKNKHLQSTGGSAG